MTDLVSAFILLALFAVFALAFAFAVEWVHDELERRRVERASYPRLDRAEATRRALRQPIARHNRAPVTADDMREALHGWHPSHGPQTCDADDWPDAQGAA